MATESFDRTVVYDRTETIATTWGLIGGGIALAVAVVLTLRSFALQGVGDGLLWFFVFGPLLVAGAYWASLLGAWLVWRAFHRH